MKRRLCVHAARRPAHMRRRERLRVEDSVLPAATTLAGTLACVNATHHAVRRRRTRKPLVQRWTHCAAVCCRKSMSPCSTSAPWQDRCSCWASDTTAVVAPRPKTGNSVASTGTSCVQSPLCSKCKASSQARRDRRWGAAHRPSALNVPCRRARCASARSSLRKDRRVSS